MRPALLAAVLVVVAVVFTAPFKPTDAGDYGNAACATHRCDDAAPAIDALQRGHVAEFFREQPAMGSFSLIVRAPAARVARAVGGDEAWQYRAGSLLCVLAAVALALALARDATARGMVPAAVFALAAVIVVNPASGDALQRGHPEEILAAAMLAGAALAAGKRPLFAGVLVGLAIATKQWALLGLFPVAFLAVDGARLRLIATSIGVAALLTLPMAIGNTGAFREATKAAANPPGSVKPLDIWLPFADSSVKSERLPDGSAGVSKVWVIPHTLDRATHWIIIGLCAALTALWWRRRERAGPAIVLLALLLLLRVLLDPRAHPYHLTPFVLVLGVVEVALIASLPWRIFTAAATVAIALRLFDDASWTAASAVFLVFAIPAALLLTVAAFDARRPQMRGYNRLFAGD